MDNLRNQDNIGENELLVVSFGTGSDESRRLNIGAVEQALEDAVPDNFSVRRCFTSQMIINIVKKKYNVLIDNVTDALERAVNNGVRTLVVQPTHIMKGFEYDKLRRILADCEESFDSIAFGDPLLETEEDFLRVAEALKEASGEHDDGRTAIVFMGHGTEADSNSVYEKLQCVMDGKSMKNYYIGTVEAAPSLEDVICAVNEGDYRRIILRPLMLVAGNHAVKDMADREDPGSWYSRFRAEGYEVECILEGLGQITAIQNIYADHALKAVDSITLRSSL